METVIYTSRVSDNHRTCILVIYSLTLNFSLYLMHPVEIYKRLYYVLYAIYDAELKFCRRR